LFWFPRINGYLQKLTPAEGLKRVRLRYLDSAGLLASLANRLLLKSATPTQRQILFWDRILVRISRLLDPLSGYNLGKSLLAVWKKTR